MKLLALASVSYCSASSVQHLLEQAFANVYKPTPEGFQLAFEPYFHADVLYKIAGKPTGIEGHYAGVNFEAKLLPNKCEMFVNKNGQFWHNPVADYLLGDRVSAAWNGMPFESKQVLNWCEVPSELIYTHRGHFNGAEFQHNAQLSVGEIQVTAKGKSGQVVFETDAQVGASFPYAKLAGKDMSLTVTTDAGMKGPCMENPFDSQCKVDVDIVTVYNGEHLPKFELDWRANAGAFTAKLGGEMQFKLKINYGDYWKLSWMCPALGQPKLTHLITLPSRETLFTVVIGAVGEFMLPYISLTTSLWNSPRDIALAVIYMDELIHELAPKDIFDCSAVVAATGFEMPYLASYLDASTVQSYAQEWCATKNDNINEFLAGRVSPVIYDGRDFLRYAVSSAGRSEYNEWQAQMLLGLE